MPYITQKERNNLDPIINELFKQCENKKGRINYCITKLAHLWVLEQLRKIKSSTKKYDILNDAYGIMCSAAAEFYSAVVVPYEKLKRKENGAISQLDEFADGKIPFWKYRCNICGEVFDRPTLNEYDETKVCPICKLSENGKI